MLIDAIYWYAGHAEAIVVTTIVSAIVIEKVRRWIVRRSTEMRSAASSLVSMAAFLSVKTLVGRVLFVALAIGVYDHLRLTTLDMFNPLTWVAVFVVRDAIYYWVHRSEHRIRVLWASHMVHHSPETISPTTSVRVPWMEALYKPWFSLWMPLIGFNPLVAVAFDVFAATLGVFQHTTACRRTTLLDKVFVTPATHRVHHGSNPEYIDKNFGAVLVVWDRLFGTYEPEVAPVVYGIGSKKIDTPAKVLVGGFPELATQLRTEAPAADKLRFLVSSPGAPLLTATAA